MTRLPGRAVMVELLAASERRLSLAEVDAYLRAPISDAEREQVLAQLQWFRRRYPTGADRLAYVRRAYRRWTTGLGPMTTRTDEHERGE